MMVEGEEMEVEAISPERWWLRMMLKNYNINQNDFLTLPTTLGAPTPTSRSSSPSELVYSPIYVELLFEFIFYSFVLWSAESILLSLFFSHFNFFPLLSPTPHTLPFLPYYKNLRSDSQQKSRFSAGGLSKISGTPTSTSTPWKFPFRKLT